LFQNINISAWDAPGILEVSEERIGFNVEIACVEKGGN
jgi:hypothetical protein